MIENFSADILRLKQNLDRYRAANNQSRGYYDGTIIPPALNLPRANRAIVSGAVGFGKIAVDAHAERLSLQGFTGPEGEENPYGLNDAIDPAALESVAGESIRESLVCGTSFITVGSGVDSFDPEVVLLPHDSSFATADISLRSRRITQGLTVFPDDPSRGELLTENLIIPFGVHEGRAFLDGDIIEHGLGRVPMVNLPNFPKAGSMKGKSEITIPMRKHIDFILRTMSSIELNRELFAWGQRYLTTDREFLDDDGNPVDPFVAAMSAMWRIPLNSDGSAPGVGTLPSNSPRDLLELLRFWASLFAASAGLPESYFGVTPEANPTAADAVRAMEARLIKRANDRTRALTRPFAELAALTVMVRDGGLPEDFVAPRPLWGDVSTISPGAAGDRALKLVSQGILQPNSRILLTELGYSKAQQDAIIRENSAATGATIAKYLAAQPDPVETDSDVVDEPTAVPELTVGE